MNTKDLESFLCVCDKNSLAKSAKILFISPQGLSKIIKKLEEELDVTLFERTPAGLTLTEYGELLKKRAKKILHDLYDIDREFNEIKNTNKIKLTAAWSHGVLNFFSPDCLSCFEKQFPHISIDYREYPDKEVDNRVYKGEFDLRITVGALDETKFLSYPLYYNQLSVLVCQKHRLKGSPSLTFTDIQNENFVIKNKESKIHDLIMSECEKVDYIPNIIYEVSGGCMCNKYCRENKAVVLTDCFTMIDPALTVIPIHSPNCTIPASIILKKDKPPTPELTLFINFMLQWCKKRKHAV